MAAHTSFAAISFEHGCSWSSDDGGRVVGQGALYRLIPGGFYYVSFLRKVYIIYQLGVIRHTPI